MKKNIGKKIRCALATGMIGLAGLTGIANEADAQTNNVLAIQTQAKAPSFSLSGDLSYFLAEKSEMGRPTSYPEINYSSKLPFGIKASGYMDFYDKGQGYFGKTIVEKSITDRLSLRAHTYQINEPFSNVGIGASYVLPAPKKLFAKVSYIPLWMDSNGQRIENKQIVGVFASIDLPKDFSFWAFGEVNPVGVKGPQWSYGEIELAKTFRKRLSVGANIQLNSKGLGKLEPEFIPRLVMRVKF